MNSFIPWVGGKSKLLWIINKMAPDHYSRFIDVFGGSGTVTMSRPIQPGCMEVYNDFNSNLTNLFCCVKNRPLALLAELGFLPLNTRDDFNVLYKFLSKGEITDDYLQEEMELTEILLKPPAAEAIRTLLLERAPRGDVRRAADFFKLVRYSFSGSSKSFGGKPCDIRRFFHLIWECSRRLANVIVENKDFEDVIRQYDRGDAWIYCDPPYFEAECYEVAFPKENHQRLHDTLLNCHVTDKKEVVGKYATADLAAGDYILSSKLSAVPAAENAYLYSMIRDGKYCGSCSGFTMSFNLTEELRQSIRTIGETACSFSCSLGMHVELFDQKLDFNIIRKIDSMRLDNFEKITKKIDALDNGDPIKVSFVSGNTDPNIHYSDMFYSEETAKNLLKETVS